MADVAVNDRVMVINARDQHFNKEGVVEWVGTVPVSPGGRLLMMFKAESGEKCFCYNNDVVKLWANDRVYIEPSIEVVVTGRRKFREIPEGEVRVESDEWSGLWSGC